MRGNDMIKRLLMKKTPHTPRTSVCIKIFQPQKKPKGKELTPEQKEHNRLISSIRIVIEHIIAGIKRCRIVKDLFRNTKEKYDDLVMEIACALHNFRVYCRQS